jgi:hypothetical protein
VWYKSSLGVVNTDMCFMCPFFKVISLVNASGGATESLGVMSLRELLLEMSLLRMLCE